jgi:HSP20 family protein
MSAIKINFKKNSQLCNEHYCYFVPVNSPFHLSHKSWSPHTDICISNDCVNIISDLSGVAINDISITYNKNFFVISGYRKFPLSEGENIFYQKEISYGDFEKKLKLPFPVDTDTIEATLKNGILIIKARKLQKKEPVKIIIG